jgi:hypothetical protein
MHDREFWWKTSLKGIRKVLQHHTYNDRVGEIFEKVGWPFETYQWNAFTVISRISKFNEARNLAEMLNSQTYRNFKVLLVEDEFSAFNKQEEQDFPCMFGEAFLGYQAWDPEKRYEAVKGSSTGDYLAIMDPACFYGKNYLLDFALAVMYSNADVLGKSTWFSLENGHLQQLHEGREYTWNSEAPNESLVIRREKPDMLKLEALLIKGIYNAGDSKILSVDPYNFIRSEDPDQTTNFRYLVDF